VSNSRDNAAISAHGVMTARARRLGTWAVMALAVLLVVDAPLLTSGELDSSPIERDGIEAARPAVAAALLEHLRDRNSSLSKEEQQRVTEAVLRGSRRHGLDPYLVTAVLLVESDARPWAESGKGAIGLMQVMPYWAEKLPLAGNLATIESNVEAGCFILADNIRRLGEKKGISSYFWGRRIRGVAYLEKVEKARARVRSARSY
jgi:Transglycosylase SLT domain